MAYTKQSWVNNDPTKPLSATRLNKLETQYDEAISQVAADVANDASTIGAALSTKIVALSGKATPALRVLVDGDSIAAQCMDEATFAATGIPNGYSWTEWANVSLSDRLRVVKNLGVGGQTSGQILARITASLEVECDIAIISALTNDLYNGAGTTVAAMKANMTAIFEAHASVGRPVLYILPGPSGYATSTTLGNTYVMHDWVRDYARENPGVYVVDAYPLAANPADGLPLDYYARPQDAMVRGVHPGYLWASQIGKALAAVLEPLMVRIPVLEAPSNADPRNVLPNGRMLGSSAGIATGYSIVKSAGGSAATATPTKIPRADGRPGEVQQIYISPPNFALDSPQLFVQDQTPGGRWAAGDTVRLVVHFETDPDTAGCYIGPISLTFWNGLGSTIGMGKVGLDASLPAGVDVQPRKGAWRTPWKTIPSGTGRLQIRVPLPWGTTRILSIEVQKAA